MLRLLDRGLTALCVAGATLVVVLLLAGPSLIGAKGHSSYGNSGTSGAQVFAYSGCGGCHTLRAAHSTGALGPNLDQLRPDASTVAAIVRSGGGSMPSFAGQLSDAKIAAVAKYVSGVAGH
ncbi:MAG: c-type cytochrome [Solirubrobacteraceae bacterium]